uniref:Uncharacterized protein n=1 Tax=Anguilla anguilla TaxID=7936 RepID=A0A0E9T9D0_ANGAN
MISWSKRKCICHFPIFLSRVDGAWPTGVFFLLTAHSKGSFRYTSV